MIRLQRILHPTDFSPPALQAMAYAQALCERFGADLHLLHVRDAPQTAALPVGYTRPDQDEPRTGDACERLSTLLPPEWEAQHSVVCSTRDGAPHAEITGYARDCSIDLIVLGTRGGGGLEHVLLGSVAERVVREAPCPVLAVRPEARQFVLQQQQQQ